MKRLILGITVSFALWAQAPNRAEVQLQAAINKETVEGDVKAAVEMYRKVAGAYKANRSVASRALLRLAEAQEKLGESEARKAYEQLVRDYGDQQPAAIARVRLAALGKSAPVMAARRIVTTMPEWWTGVPNPTSPDGRYLFNSLRPSGVWEPALLDLTTGQQRTFPKPKGLGYVDTGVISADNRMIAFTGQPGSNLLNLVVVDFDGANPRTVFTSRPAFSWFYPVGITPDKKTVVLQFNRQGGRGYHLGRVDLATGALTVVREFTTGRLGPARLSPDGQWIAYAYQPLADNPYHDIFVISTNGDTESVLVEHAADDTSPVWTPDGKGVVFLTNRRGTHDLWFVPVHAGRPAGELKPLKNDIGDVEVYGMTSGGSLVYRAASGTVTFQHSTLDEATGKFTHFRPLSESFSGTKLRPRISPDEKQIAYVRQPAYAKNKAIIGVRDLTTNKEREIYPNLRQVQYVLWMPDQRRFLVTGQDYGGQLGDFLVDAVTGQTTPLPTKGDLGGYSRGGGGAVVSPDGKTLYVPHYKQASGALFAKDIATGTARLLIEAKGFANAPSPSPDGRWLAFLDNGPNKVGRLLSLTDGSVRDLPERAIPQGWTRDSKVAYVWSEGNSLREVNGKKLLTLFGLNLESGVMSPVNDPLDYSYFDGSHLLGNSFVYRDNRRTYEIMALDNVLSAAK